MNEEKENYNRLIKASQAEKILGSCKIHIDVSKLSIFNQVNPSDEKMAYYLAAKDTGFISTKYASRGKITARMFTTPNNLNLITLSDSEILKCIDSRFDPGYIVEIDYSSYEFGIACGLMGFTDFDGLDVHQMVAEELKIERNKAKKLVYAMLYGMSDSNLANIVTPYQIDNLTSLFMEFLNAKNEYLISLESQFDTSQYVTNVFGRKIYPKHKGNIFNNVIQTTGSDIMIDTVIRIKKLEKFNILFHRFDSLYFDFTKDDLYKSLSTLIEAMNQSELEVNFNLQTAVYVGKSAHNLKKLKMK